MSRASHSSRDRVRIADRRIRSSFPRPLTSSAAATGLARLGFRRGDVLAIYSPNLPEYAVCFNAVASLGGASTTINPLYTADEAAKQLADAGGSSASAIWLRLKSTFNHFASSLSVGIF